MIKSGPQTFDLQGKNLTSRWKVTEQTGEGLAEAARPTMYANTIIAENKLPKFMEFRNCWHYTLQVTKINSFFHLWWPQAQLGRLSIAIVCS